MRVHARHMVPSVVLSIELALALGACVIGPSDPVYEVWVENSSPRSYLVLVDDYAASSTHVFRVPPDSGGVTIAEFGQSQGGRIVVMDPDCNTLAAYAITSHIAGVVIAEDGSLEYVADRGLGSAETEPRRFRATEECQPPRPT